MGPHFWIKQCIELMLSSACPAATLTNCTPSSLLPPVTGVIAMADPLDRSEKGVYPLAPGIFMIYVTN
jgi:transformation/transcription domain-associated protein